MDRVTVYGKDLEDREKRAFDFVKENGSIYLETVNRAGHKIKTTLEEAWTALAELDATEKTEE